MGQRAIHFGTGALGLGLICWAFRSLGLKVVAVNRSAANNDRNDKLKKDRGFMVRYPSDPEETERVELEDFYYVPEASREVDTLVRDPKTVILTTALKYTGIESMRDVLKELFIARSETRSPLLFIACENAISSQDAFDSILKGLTDAEKSAIQAFVIPVNCVVDRICNKPVMEDQSVVVTSEKFAH